MSLSQTLAEELAGTGVKIYTHLARPDRDGAAAQARARGGPEHDHAAEPVADVIAMLVRDDEVHARRTEHHRSPRGPEPPDDAGSNTVSPARSSGSSGSSPRLLPSIRDRVVLATARVSALEGNLLFIHRALRARHPEVDCVLLLEPYGYGLRGKLAYLARLVRGMYHLRTAGLFVVDNAYLPVHVAPHRRTTTVVQVWHAVGALKRFGPDTAATARRARADLPASLLRRRRGRR